MANNTTGNPWILDTAGTVTADLVRVRMIRWDAEGAAAGDNATLTNTAGRTFWAASAAGVNTGIESDMFEEVSGNVQGLKVGAINAGKLYVYLA